MGDPGERADGPDVAVVADWPAAGAVGARVLDGDDPPVETAGGRGDNGGPAEGSVAGAPVEPVAAGAVGCPNERRRFVKLPLARTPPDRALLAPAEEPAEGGAAFSTRPPVLTVESRSL